MALFDPVDAEEPSHILVVDDDTRLRELLRKFLSEHGYFVSVAADAAEARTQLAALSFDLLIVDVMMPGEDGLSLTRALRMGEVPGGEVPVLMLTARGEAEDRIVGLEQGADDYLPKPFDPRELLLRVKAILRRIPKREQTAESVREIVMGEAVFDCSRRELHQGGERIHLTAAEGDILAALAVRVGEFLDRDQLAEAAGLEGGGRTVDVQMTRLRKKIEPDSREPRYLQTVRGRGYVLRPSEVRNG